MSWFDAVIIGIVGFSTYWSFKQGFILEVSFFVGTIVGLLLAFVGYPYSEPFFTSILGSSTMGATVSFLFVFALGGIMVTIAGMFVQKFVDGLALRGLDRLLGGVIGFVKAVIGVCVMVVILTGIQENNPPAYLNNSLLAKPLVRVTTQGMEQVPPVFETFMEDYGEPSLEWLDSV
jgi:uncharacterized membrane protein required for colicin V production